MVVQINDYSAPFTRRRHNPHPIRRCDIIKSNQLWYLACIQLHFLYIQCFYYSQPTISSASIPCTHLPRVWLDARRPRPPHGAARLGLACAGSSVSIQHTQYVVVIGIFTNWLFYFRISILCGQNKNLVVSAVYPTPAGQAYFPCSRMSGIN